MTDSLETLGLAILLGVLVGFGIAALLARRIKLLAQSAEHTADELAEREFVSNAAHELRNPIAGISSAIEVLQSGAKDDPEARERFLARLSADADRLTRITQALLTLARAEAMEVEEPEIVAVAAVAEEAVEALEAPPGLEPAVAVPEDLLVLGDTILLRQVLIGLLSNAYKHTPAPGRVELRARREEELEGEILIEVADSGTGIAPDDLGRIFERFYRGRGTLEKDGFGLGLPIAKRMVDIMGGDIGVSSTLGQGTTFSVRLPAAQSAPTPTP